MIGFVDPFYMLAGVLGIVLAMLFHIMKVGQFQRNSLDVQFRLTESASKFCQQTSRPLKVIPCDQGPYPLLAFTSLFLDFLLESRAIIICDDELILVARSPGEAHISNVISYHRPGALQVIRLRGLYGKVQLGTERLWIERKYFKDVCATVSSSG